MQSHFIFNVPRTNSSDYGLSEGLSFLFGSFSSVSSAINYNIEGKKAKRPSYLNACLCLQNTPPPVPFHSVLQVPDLSTSLPDCSSIFSSFPLPSFSHFLFYQRHPATNPGLSPGHCHCPHPYPFSLSKGLSKGPSHHLSKPGYQFPWQLQPPSFCHHCRHQ